MYFLDKYDVILDIRLEPGIHVFTGYSATGKTFLARKLEEYRTFGEPVCAYSYGTSPLSPQLKSVLDAGMKVIVLDRCDMYMDDAVAALSAYQGNAIILVDTKQIPKFNSYDFCSIRLLERGILVV